MRFPQLPLVRYVVYPPIALALFVRAVSAAELTTYIHYYALASGLALYVAFVGLVLLRYPGFAEYGFRRKAIVLGWTLPLALVLTPVAFFTLALLFNT